MGKKRKGGAFEMHWFLHLNCGGCLHSLRTCTKKSSNHKARYKNFRVFSIFTLSKSMLSPLTNARMCSAEGKSLLLLNPSTPPFQTLYLMLSILLALFLTFISFGILLSFIDFLPAVCQALRGDVGREPTDTLLPYGSVSIVCHPNLITLQWGHHSSLVFSL
jgi:hypothetical protein